MGAAYFFIFSFSFFLYSNSGLKIMLSSFPASMNCNSELKKDKCTFARKVLFPLSFACTKFWWWNHSILPLTYIECFFPSWRRVGELIWRGYLCIIFSADSSIYGIFLKCVWQTMYRLPSTYFARNNSRKGTCMHYGNESLHEILTLK